jgi:hypothetical protein
MWLHHTSQMAEAQAGCHSLSAAGGLSKAKPLALKRHEEASANDEMIQTLHIEQLPRLDDRSCDGDVLRRRLRRAAGVVVSDQNGGGVGSDRRAKYLGDTDERAVQGAVVKIDRLADDPVAGVQEQDHKVFLLKMLHPVQQESGGVVGRLDHGLVVRPGDAQATSELKRRPESSRRGGPGASHLLDLSRTCLGESVHRPELAQERLGDLDLLSSTDEGSQELHQVASFRVIGRPPGWPFPEWERLKNRLHDLVSAVVHPRA